MKKRRILYLALVLLVVLLALWLLPKGGEDLSLQTPPQTDAPETQSLQLLEPQSTDLQQTEPASSPAQDPQPSEEPTAQTEESTTEPAQEAPTEALLDEDGWYYSKDEVALYIHQYGKLPGNFITKKEAEALGWPGGSLEPYASGKVLGGTYFGNYEGLLPTAPGRTYTECDIDTLGKRSRGAKRIVFSNDGLIYYTDDHYESFELLYGEDDT